MNKFNNIEDIYNVTPFQQTVISNYLKAPGAGLYLMNLKIRFEGSFDKHIFTQSWKNIIRKYPAFRTSFHKGASGTFYQAIQKDVDFEPEFIDWSDIDKHTQNDHFQKLLENDILNDYELKDPPFTRITVINESSGSFLIWWRFPQLLMDGWNIPVVLLDFFDFYRKIASSIPFNIKPDYSLKEYVQTLKTRDKAEEIAFWKQYLAGYKPVHTNISQKIISKNSHIRLDKKISHLYASIVRLTQKYKLNINTVFQASYMLALAKLGFSSRKDSICGTTVTDRPLSLENNHTRVGLYLNILPMRMCSIPDGILFVEWLAAFQKEILTALRFTSGTENEIKDYCGFSHEESLSDNLIIFENMPYNKIDFEGLPFKMSNYDFENRPNAKLSLFVWPEENMLLKLIFDKNYYGEEEAQCLLDEIEYLLNEWTGNESISMEDMKTRSVVATLNEALL